MPDITQARLKELFDYDPINGAFVWKLQRSNRAKVGSEAGSIASNGRRYIHVDGMQILAHRLAWLYVHGNWPKQNLSAIDGDYLNLAIANYVETTYADVARRGLHRKSGSSGTKGVSWDKSRELWIAHITRDYKRIFLGRYKSKDDAANAYRQAAAGCGIPVTDQVFRDASAKKLACKAKQRIVWNRVLREAGGVTGWASFTDFAHDIGHPPKSGYSVAPTDQSIPVGPSNFVWVQCVAKTFDTSTREGRVAYGRAYRAANPNSFKHRHLEKTFGITLARYQELLLEQNGVCAICKKPELNVGRNGKVLSLAVDHCHDSGVVRSLLCLNCNQGLGSFRDDPALMRRAIEYVHWHAQQVSLVPPDNVVPIKRKVR